MKVHVKIFPAAELCNQRRELEIDLDEGNGDEILEYLQKLLGVNLKEKKTLMFLHNGCGLERLENAVFQDGDQLWLLPLLSGG